MAAVLLLGRRRAPLLATVATAALVAPPSAPAALLFSTGPQGAAPGQQRLYIAQSDGSHRRLVATGRQALSLSPDGHWALAVDGKFRPVLLDLRAHHARILTGLGIGSGAWAPDSSRFLSLGPSGLFVVNPRHPTGTGRHRLLPDDDAAVSRGAFSPGGTMVVYTRIVGGSSSDVWRVRINGTGRKRLTFGGTSSSAAWGPTRIAFSRLAANPGPNGEDLHQVWVMHADGTGKRQLTHRTPPPFTRGYGPQQWLPDGSGVIAQLLGAGICVAQRVDARTGAVRSLSASGALDDAFPLGVSKDSRYLLALTGDPCGSGGGSTLRRIPIASPSQARTLAGKVFGAGWNR